jgi:hypothetical protein
MLYPVFVIPKRFHAVRQKYFRDGCFPIKTAGESAFGSVADCDNVNSKWVCWSHVRFVVPSVGIDINSAPSLWLTD